MDGLDAVKKGTDITNVNSRESIRYFDRIQNGSLAVRGVNFQDPSEAFETWKECEAYMIPGATLPRKDLPPTPAASPQKAAVDPTTPPSSPGRKSNDTSRFSPNRERTNGVIVINGMGDGNGNGNGVGRRRIDENRRSNTFPRQQQHQQPRQQRQLTRSNTQNGDSLGSAAPIVPPRRIQQLINCVLYKKHQLGKRSNSPTHQEMQKRPDINLITNNPEVAEWARLFDINVMSSNQMEDLLEREDFIFAEKQKEYEDFVAAKQTTNSNSNRGGRGGRRGGGSVGGGRCDFDRGGGIRSGGGRGERGASEPDFVFVREAPRGVARGKGKLWEP